MSEQKQRGRLIVFEGTDGTGKTTQRDLLGQYLLNEGHRVIITKEPTNGPFGMQIRDLYRNRANYSREQELELFLADRRQHVTDVLLPGLQAGMIILCDRYYFSTAAYQGALGFDPEAIIALNAFAPPPDLVLLLKANLDMSLQRISIGRGDIPNNFEQKLFLEKVAEIFSTIKRPYIFEIDASGTVEQVHSLVINQVTRLLASHSQPPRMDV